MKKNLISLGVLLSLLSAQPVQAFGIGDLVSVGVQLGGQVVGAAVSKAQDSMRDPEAEKAKEEAATKRAAEAYQRQIDAINARTDLTPLQREKLVLILQRQYDKAAEGRRMLAYVEQQQRAESQKILTADGLAGAVGSAVLNSPTAVMARADAVVKSGQVQDMTNRTLSQVDNRGNRITPVAQPDKTQLEGQVNQAMQQAVDANAEAIKSAQAAAKGNTPTATPAPQVADAFMTQDKGRKLYVTFSGSDKLTSQIRDALKTQGYNVVEKPEEAEVKYWFGGEYGVNETRQNDGLQDDIGAWYDNPHKIDPPAAKSMAKASGILSGAMLAMAGVKAPQVAASTGLQQYALVVAARQPAEGKETRISTLEKDQNDSIKADTLIPQALNSLMDKAGIRLRGGVGVSVASGV